MTKIKPVNVFMICSCKRKHIGPKSAFAASCNVENFSAHSLKVILFEIRAHTLTHFATFLRMRLRCSVRDRNAVKREKRGSK